ncbi:Hypothetical protein NTJ_10584 [Nesidiocoris tenuis]|uniref:Uncharacterized protein n=1 Tax=Nesidiocoris tenuis TaxID=355587 RepID=A0ABN7B3L0_9HEMI|nr:Hypothetical protein NTJ_10584 [Nesidiocoris tenuis]
MGKTQVGSSDDTRLPLSSQQMKTNVNTSLPSTHVHRMVVKRLFGASLTHPSVAMSTTKTEPGNLSAQDELRMLHWKFEWR